MWDPKSKSDAGILESRGGRHRARRGAELERAPRSRCIADRGSAKRDVNRDPDRDLNACAEWRGIALMGYNMLRREAVVRALNGNGNVNVNVSGYA